MNSVVTKTALLLVLALLMSFKLQGQAIHSRPDRSDYKKHSGGSKVYNSYHGLVMTGYQGWFNTPTDGANKGWTHYKKNSKFEPGYSTIDFWPDMTEYPKKYETSFKFPDGSPAYVFSSYDSSTIDLHYKWMADYGIDGAFMQRFSHSIADPTVKNHYYVVFDAAMKAARKYNRAITIRYDITGLKNKNSSILLADLDSTMARYNNFGRDLHPMFLYHKGKPLIAFGGVGFRGDSIPGDVGYLDEAEIIIAGLRKRGFSILMRVPAKWRDFSGTAVVNLPDDMIKLHALIKSVDIIMPWHVGAYREDTYTSGSWSQFIRNDMDWCTNNNIEYVPVVFPGFSRYNLKGIDDGSFRPRNKGTFYWLQAQSAVSVGAQMLFQAQFDEVDEGTQISKCVKVAPVNPLNTTLGSFPFITYEKDIETDHYLWLVGKSAEMLRGEIPITATMPTRSVAKVEANNNSASTSEEFMAYPNPIHSSTRIEYRLPATCRVSIKIYDLIGREIAILLNQEQNFGNHNAQWDVKSVSPGIYFAVIYAHSTSDQRIIHQVKKLLVVR